jgi:hypothetical protein
MYHHIYTFSMGGIRAPTQTIVDSRRPIFGYLFIILLLIYFYLLDGRYTGPSPYTHHRI